MKKKNSKKKKNLIIENIYRKKLDIQTFYFRVLCEYVISVTIYIYICILIQPNTVTYENIHIGANKSIIITADPQRHICIFLIGVNCFSTSKFW